MIDTVANFLIGQQGTSGIEPLEYVVHAGIVIGIELLHYEGSQDRIPQPSLILLRKILEGSLEELTLAIKSLQPEYRPRVVLFLTVVSVEVEKDTLETLLSVDDEIFPALLFAVEEYGGNRQSDEKGFDEFAGLSLLPDESPLEFGYQYLL